MTVTTRPARASDLPECARIGFDAFADIAARHGFPSDFTSLDIATAVVSGLIEHPGFFSLVAEVDGRIVGSSFLDERGMIIGVGHVTVDPAVQGRRIGRALMGTMLQRCAHRKVPGVRLLQASYNYRAMSLYAKFGFDVREPFAAMQGDPLGLRIPGYAVRAATAADLPACDTLCIRVHGHDRGGGLRDALARGTARVVERDGRITGYTSGIGFYGHAVAETNDDLQALIGAADEISAPGFLVPMRNTDLVRWCLAHGLRVFVVLNLMTIGLYSEPRGAFLASVWY
ncbi:GNAT family N-acetyltransferase [Mycobacterium sp.]|uniref:GNAT family N-acetyltransferase n=1 Tax=Mycobacterium sp. TaxID=1785 RepID=UPI002C990687|nr:GNAT family N-acetyltransferase [Mycobacterium sp.]HTY33937.1 GNAT family N-acetyltransferase [Mycobacterium sp.]